MKRLNDQVAFRVLPKERRLLERAARKQGKSLSEWTRITTVVEAEIQLGVGLPEVPVEVTVADGTRGMERGR